jgi:hypothetical protein
MTPQEIYECNRADWYLSARADRERYTVFSSTALGTIVAVVANEAIEETGSRRRTIKGTVLGPGHPVHDALIGQSMLDTSRNPVTYHDAPIDQRTCACGCGEPVSGGRMFLPGHDPTPRSLGVSCSLGLYGRGALCMP